MWFHLPCFSSSPATAAGRALMHGGYEPSSLQALEVTANPESRKTRWASVFGTRLKTSRPCSHLSPFSCAPCCASRVLYLVCLVGLGHVTSRNIRSTAQRRVASSYVVLRRGASHRVVSSYRVVSCHLMSCHVVDQGGFEPPDRRKPPGSWESRCRKGSIRPYVRFHPFPKFPGFFGTKSREISIRQPSTQNFPEILGHRLQSIQVLSRRTALFPRQPIQKAFPRLQNFPEISSCFTL